MAAGVLSAPGTEFGTCAEPCLHTDCAGTRSIAETICRFCDKRLCLRKGIIGRFMRQLAFLPQKGVFVMSLT